jgi:outer membrane biosynthesis protein TonB
MTPGRKLATLVALALLVLGGAGCHRQKVQAAAPPPAAPPASANPQPAPAPPSSTATPPEGKPATPPGETPANPAPETPAPKPVTPRPHVNPAPPAAPEPAPPPRPAPPQIRPSLSPAQTAEYKKKTNEDIAEAEKNLQRAYGRELSQEQRDLVEKIRGFLTQAREAGDAGDWGRAVNLAEKARLLSAELANSL